MDDKKLRRAIAGRKVLGIEVSGELADGRRDVELVLEGENNLLTFFGVSRWSLGFIAREWVEEGYGSGDD